MQQLQQQEEEEEVVVALSLMRFRLRLFSSSCVIQTCRSSAFFLGVQLSRFHSFSVYSPTCRHDSGNDKLIHNIMVVG